MAIIKTERNHVYAYEPLPDDSFVRTYLGTPDGRKLLSTRPIDGCQAAVDWAVGMADEMAFPINIVPISAEEFAQQNRERLAQLDHQQRGRLRQVAVASMLEVLRDCPDPGVRAGAYEILKTLGVGQ